MTKLTGHCLCEKITYQYHGEIDIIPVYNCHCSMCRRWTGDAFRTSTLIHSNKFKWVSGEYYLSKYNYKNKAVKTFCSQCGTHLLSMYQGNPDVYGVSLGMFDQDPMARPIANIFVGSKACWHELDSDLPSYPERVT